MLPTKQLTTPITLSTTIMHLVPCQRRLLLIMMWILSMVPNDTADSIFGETFLTSADFAKASTIGADELDNTRALSMSDYLNGQRLRNVELIFGRRVTSSLDQQHASHRKLHQQNNYKGDIRGKATWSLQYRNSGVRRNGVIGQLKQWPNARIPYVISNQYNDRERALLARAFDEYHRRTCVRFVPRTLVDNDYLYIGKIDGCFSDVGRAGGRQELSLDDGCLEYDTAIHELMHAVGFYHEHERWDRDQYINILWQNIDREAYDQFGRVDLSDSSYYNTNYDYFSIMHYDSLAFSKNGFETLVARRPEMTRVIGNAVDFSATDLAKINKMYECPESTGTSWNSWPPTTTPLPPPPLLPPLSAPPPPLPVAQPISLMMHHPEVETCRDRTNLCWRWLDRCHSYFFEKIMREFCPQSCGFCSTPTTSSNSIFFQPQSSHQSPPIYQRFG